MTSRDWVDLAAASESLKVEADVCLVGAGAAGLYLARQLSDRGHSVVLVEAGPLRALGTESAGFLPEFGVDPYPGATLGRYFGLGGTTSHWGGALVPHTAHDLGQGRPDLDVWAHIVSTVSAQSTAVLKVLGYSREPEFEAFAQRCLGVVGTALQESGLAVQSGLLLPFRRKNLLHLLDGAGQGARNQPRVFYQAVAKTWLTQGVGAGDARVEELLAVSRNGHELRVTARRFILTAGAIESARILLEMNGATYNRLLRPGAQTGVGLSDHLSVPIADVPPKSNACAIRWFAPRFQGSWMRGLRMLEGMPDGTTPRYFAHFVFPMESAGFRVAKELLGAIQARRMPRIGVGDLLRGMGDLTQLAMNQYLRSRLYLPPNQPIRLQLDMEQAANPENRVSLSHQIDEYGRRLAHIDWRITDRDLATITATADSLLARWPDQASGLPELIPRPIGSEHAKPHDAYHPAGTCRMGHDAGAVVDHDLKVWGVDNLWVVSTGVLPTAGTANPTFTMLCLAQKLAGRFNSLQ
jgi:choline dehydrogenase-like flavoprotein